MAEREPLSEVASHLLEECRMVLPGIQALFGFQLIAVFNTRFWDGLTQAHRTLHLAATALVAVSVALVMTPAAYHRQVLQESISRRFITIASRCLLLSMFPLLVGIAFDLYLIADLILDSPAGAFTLALALSIVYMALWFGLPRVVRG
jgi:hypothetical protein